MARQIPPTRITDIARAACKVFTEKGYRRALMTDVGRQLGLSHALLYRYVESKEALFQLALLYAIDPATLPTLPVPLPTPRPGDAFTPIAAWMSGNSTFTALGAALSRERSDDVRREFTAVVDELYSAVETNHVFLALVESSAVDLPELASLYFGQARGGQVDRLGTYLEVRMRAGQLRRVPDVGLATRFIVETVAWFAWHRRDDRTGASIPDDEARASTLFLLGAALVPDDQLDEMDRGRP